MSKKKSSLKSKKNIPEREYEFFFVVNGITPENFAAVSDALFEAGCDDSTPAISNGIPIVDFSRAAPSMRSALLSALRDIDVAANTAKVDLEVTRIDAGELASGSEIAERTGRTRQSIHLYFTGKRGSGDFPLPLKHLSSEALIWRWSEVAVWLHANKLVDEQTVTDARDADAISLAIAVKKLKKAKAWKEIAAAVGA